jgi:DNA-binding MarR family transcriptional regulator
MLQHFITSKTRRKIIILFSKYPDYKVHIRGLAKITKEDPGNVSRELSRLEKIGYVRSARDANTKVYWANKNFLLFKELQSMVLKTSSKRSKSV